MSLWAVDCVFRNERFLITGVHLNVAEPSVIGHGMVFGIDRWLAGVRRDGVGVANGVFGETGAVRQHGVTDLTVFDSRHGLISNDTVGIWDVFVSIAWHWFVGHGTRWFSVVDAACRCDLWSINRWPLDRRVVRSLKLDRVCLPRWATVGFFS